MNAYGHYSTPRWCERDGCDYETTDRQDYWNHRLDHEHGITERTYTYDQVKAMTPDEWYAADCPPWRDPVTLGPVVIRQRQRFLETLGPTWAARVSLLTLLTVIIGVLVIAGALTQ